MKIIKLTKANFNKTVNQVKTVLKANGLVVLPSDTAYGLGANACSGPAVGKVYDFKGRRFAKGLSVYLNDLDKIGKYTLYDQKQEAILKTLLPGPFTVVLRSKGKVASEAEPGDGTLGVRIIDHSLVQRLAETVSFPITATSANLAGKGPHYSIDSFVKTLSDKKKSIIDLVVDAGPLPRRPVSTVVRLVGDEIKVLRKGTLGLKRLLVQATKSEAETQKAAQGIYQKHLVKNLKDHSVVVIMKGELGAGKTAFAKGIGELFDLGLTSPTFVLLDEYPVGKFPLKNLYHLDLFRIESEAEIAELKLEKFLKKGNLMLIEWGEKLSVFEKLKSEKVIFYLLQIEETGKTKRRLSLYQL